MTTPRLHVLTATNSPMAVILRRGPSGQVASLGWNRDTHEITMGQWLKGRIYEHRADLSPDGRHMVYFAGKGGTHWWTAVSRAPYLRALVFLPQSSTWHGGGAFEAPGRVWLNGGGDIPASAAPELRPARDAMAYPHSTDGFHMGALYAAMMARRGWSAGSAARYETVLSRPLSGGWRLEMHFVLGARNRALISPAYSLVNDAASDLREKPDWEWADQRGDRLQVAAGGRLHEMRLSGNGDLTDARIVADFRATRFEALEAPYRGVRDAPA